MDQRASRLLSFGSRRQASWAQRRRRAMAARTASRRARSGESLRLTHDAGGRTVARDAARAADRCGQTGIYCDILENSTCTVLYSVTYTVLILSTCTILYTTQYCTL